VLDVSSGPLSMAEASGELLGRIERQIRQGRAKILLNLKDVLYVDSGGLAEIVRGFHAARQAGGQLALCHLVPRMRELMTVTRLDAHIPVFESEEDAIRSFTAPA
jgi:anti-anti-sigma factor